MPPSQSHLSQLYTALALPKTVKSEKVGGKSGIDTLFSGDDSIDARYDV
jgi:hypothetical protein